MADIKRKAEATWTGSLKEGIGKASGESGAFKDVECTFPTRFGDEKGSNPEELIGAAHSTCFSMQLSGLLGRDGHEPNSIHTEATVAMQKSGGGFKVSSIHLKTTGDVPGIDQQTFQKLANEAKEACPISKLLMPGLDEMTLDATLS